MKVSELINKLEPYKGFELEAILHLEVAEEELQKRTYKYPVDNFEVELSIDDVGYSDKILQIGVEIKKENDCDEPLA